MTMSESCTIVSPVKNAKRLIDVLQEMGAEVDYLNGDAKDWQSVSVKSDECEIVFNILSREVPGDRFSQLILGMHNFARKLQVVHEQTAANVLKTVADAQMLIGVVATPSFSQNEQHEDYVFEIAKSIGGIVFNGDSFLSADGMPLLSASS